MNIFFGRNGAFYWYCCDKNPNAIIHDKTIFRGKEKVHHWRSRHFNQGPDNLRR